MGIAELRVGVPVNEVPLTKVYEAKVGVPLTFSVDPVRFTAPELVMVTRFCSRVPAAVNAPTLIPPEDCRNLRVAPLLTVTALAAGKLPDAPTWSVPPATVVTPL